MVRNRKTCRSSSTASVYATGRGAVALPGPTGIFQTDLNRCLLESARGHELRLRTPMRRFGEIEELVGAGVFLASDQASFITGQLLVVDGGFLASGVNQ